MDLYTSPKGFLRQEQHLGYRPDIDGLRAIAVASVIGFHALPNHISGGFVGVDIFFVISGFLISSIILKTSATGKFSILDFYTRRIRRIFPALIFVLISCLLAGWLLLFPDEIKQLGKHVLSTNFFVLNFTLWSEDSYFDTASELKPLLHLWSLSIEEQFYTLWPLTLLFLIKYRKPGLLITALTLASFLLCVSGFLGKTANFYMPLSRTWELLCGGVLAYIQSSPNTQFKFLANKPDSQRILNEAGSLIGILLLGLAIFYLDSKTVFPGWASLLPTLGATILIAVGPSTLMNRHIVGNRFFVFIGLISYPLYLWHWPLLSFPKIAYGLHIPIETKIISVSLAVILAALTYYLVEKPLRHKGNVVSLCLLLITLITAGIGAMFYSGALQTHKVNIFLQEIADTKNDNPFNSPLSKTYVTLIDKQEYRVVGKGKKITLYIGDSNMEQHWQGVDAIISAGDDSRKAMITGCRLPILNTRKKIKEGYECPAIETNAHAFSLATANPDIDTIVIGAQWLGTSGFEYIEGDHKYPLSSPEGMQKAMDQLASTILDMTKQGKTVYLLLNIPGGTEFEPHNLVKRSLLGLHFQNTIRLEGGISLEEHKKRTQKISPILRDVAKRSGAIVLDPADFLCVSQWCSAVTTEGNVIYRDSNHLRGSYSHYHPEFIGQTLK
ncbi:MAG TPA: acyltransferase family protein [Pseudomonadales bacterium]|nr:acyltransferase family protein [Pseudomonadales bacterium]